MEEQLIAFLLFLGMDPQGALQKTTGVVELPPGVWELSRELRLFSESKRLTIRGSPKGTLLRAKADFEGKALLRISGGGDITIENIEMDGNRQALARPVGLPDYGTPFFEHYSRNGIAVERVDGLTIRDVHIREVADYPILVRRCTRVTIERVEIRDSGGVDSKGFNNASGGILLEDGTRDFTVRDSKLVNILGNGIWTHSRADAPVNRQGRIEHNWIQRVGRDAIQVGQASDVRVSENSGREIGYPAAMVDAGSWAVPVALDTSGDVERTVYEDNTFEEINGKCIDLDGFHHGAVRRNTCVNRKPVTEYPNGHFGVVFNNTNPFLEPDEIELIDNVITGMKYGGIFVIGRGHVIRGNRLEGVNLAGCPKTHAEFGCYWLAEEPDMLMSGIYLGHAPADHRAATSRGNRVEDNVITGMGMPARCVVTAPGIEAGANVIRNNQCRESNE